MTSDFCERRILKFRLIRILFTIRRDSFEIALVEKIPLDIFPRGSFFIRHELIFVALRIR